jgi:hypothetical protein
MSSFLKDALTVPIYLPGQEPLPPGYTEEDRAQLAQMKYWSSMTSHAMEFCPTKCALSGGAGFALGGFFSLFSSSFAIDDPLRRSNLAQAHALANEKGLPHPPELTTTQQTKQFFKDTGKGMYRSAKGFGKVGALYSGIECCIEGVSLGVLSMYTWHVKLIDELVYYLTSTEPRTTWSILWPQDSQRGPSWPEDRDPKQ